MCCCAAQKAILLFNLRHIKICVYKIKQTTPPGSENILLHIYNTYTHTHYYITKFSASYKIFFFIYKECLKYQIHKMKQNVYQTKNWVQFPIIRHKNVANFGCVRVCVFFSEEIIPFTNEMWIRYSVFYLCDFSTSLIENIYFLFEVHEHLFEIWFGRFASNNVHLKLSHGIDFSKYLFTKNLA